MNQKIIHGRQVREELYQLTISLPKTLHILTQEILTWMTGKPYQNQQPLFQQTPLGYLALALSELALGVTASIAILNSSFVFLPLLPLSFLFTVGGARILETTIIHQCVHLNFFWRNQSWNRWLAEALSTAIMTQNFDGYFRDHVRNHHNRKIFTTANDPALRLLLKLGFCPGLTKKEYWKRLVRAIFSPSFHLSLLKERLISNFLTSPPYRRVMSAVWSLGCLSLAFATQNVMNFSIAWLLPLTVLHTISALLHALTEHLWGYEKGGQSQQVIYLRKTCGRFSAEPPPHTLLAQNPLPWLGWLLRLILVHLPVRLSCWVGEVPEHDYHHRHSHQPNWANGAFIRQREIEAGCPGFPEPYTEIWGIVSAIDLVFDTLSQGERKHEL